MMINPIQQQNHNNQTFSALKFKPQAKASWAGKNLSKEITTQITDFKAKKVLLKNGNQPSFWQKIKMAWGMVNKLQ